MQSLKPAYFFSNPSFAHTKEMTGLQLTEPLDTWGALPIGQHSLLMLGASLGMPQEFRAEERLQSRTPDPPILLCPQHLLSYPPPICPFGHIPYSLSETLVQLFPFPYFPIFLPLLSYFPPQKRFLVFFWSFLGSLLAPSRALGSQTIAKEMLPS